jgi:hypothetical protein
MSLTLALAFLIAYFLVSIEVYLATYTLSTFRMSFLGFGPTELRILLAIGNLVVLARPAVDLFGSPWKLFDVGAAVAVPALIIAFAMSAVRNGRALFLAEPRSAERSGRAFHRQLSFLKYRRRSWERSPERPPHLEGPPCRSTNGERPSSGMVPPPTWRRQTATG